MRPHRLPVTTSGITDLLRNTVAAQRVRRSRCDKRLRAASGPAAARGLRDKCHTKPSSRLEEQSCRRLPAQWIRPQRRRLSAIAEWTAIMDGRFSDVDTRWHSWEQFRDRHRRPESGGGAGARRHRPGRRHRFDGAAARRDRHRQGALRHPDPRAQRPPRPQHGSRQLLGDPGDADGERVVRPRARRLYRRACAPDRPLRAGRSVVDLPR